MGVERGAADAAFVAALLSVGTACRTNVPITRPQILDFSKLKEFADDNFKFDENGRKLSKQVENTVGKGEIAHYEQFLLFPQCFQKACFPGASKGVIVWEWVKSKDKILRKPLKKEMKFMLKTPENAVNHTISF